MSDNFEDDFGIPADAMFGDDDDSIEEGELYGDSMFEEDSYREPEKAPEPEPQPAPEAQVVDPKMNELQEKVNTLEHQINEAGLIPQQTDKELEMEYARMGMDSPKLKEMAETIGYDIGESQAQALMKLAVDQARAAHPEVQYHNENDASYALRTDKNLSQLYEWMNNKDPRFQQAVELDTERSKDPAYAGMSLNERFKQVQSDVARGVTINQQQEVSIPSQGDFDGMSEEQTEEYLSKLVDYL